LPQFGEASAPLPQFGEASALLPQFGEASEPLPQFGEASEPSPQFGEASEPLPQFGEKCYEHTKAKVIGKHGKRMIRSKKWCADALVCSKTTWTCKVAIMQPCNKTWIPGVSQCAGTGTYGRTTTCGKQKHAALDLHGPPTGPDGPIHSAQEGREDHLPECCSGKGDFIVVANYFLPNPEEAAWMCTP